MIQGYKPTKKTLAYIKRMISRKSWRVNERIPTIEKISKINSVSQYTVRKCIKILEKEGILENFGSLGFYVRSDHTVKKNRYWTSILKGNVEVAKILEQGGITIGKFALKYIPATNSIKFINVASGKGGVAELHELEQSVEKPLCLKKVLRSEDTNLALKIWKRQEQIKPVAQIVIRKKKELGIHE